MAVVDEAKLRYLDFLSREDRVRHHRYVEEMKQYDMMRSGDINAIAESTRLWDSGLYGYLSDDPLKNAKYRFVTTITLATRFAIEGGMDEEDAYNASDLYIQNLENCKTPDDVRRLHTDMMTFFTWAMADMQKAETHSKAVNPRICRSCSNAKRARPYRNTSPTSVWKRPRTCSNTRNTASTRSPRSSHTGRKATSRRCSKNIPA